MQFLYHIRQEKEKAIESQHHYRAMAAAKGALAASTDGKIHSNCNGFTNVCNSQPYSSDLCEFETENCVMGVENFSGTENTIVAKRKLYFSAGKIVYNIFYKNY